LTGSLPSELGNLTNLRYLRAGFIEIGGKIPPGLGNLGGLRWLVLTGNRLSGAIPGKLGDTSSPTHLWE